MPSVVAGALLFLLALVFGQVAWAGPGHEAEPTTGSMTANSFCNNPDNRLLAPGNISASVSGNSGTVTWTHGGITTPDGFKVRYSAESDFSSYQTSYAYPGSAESETIGGLDYGTTYYVIIQAYLSESGQHSDGPCSLQESFTTDPPPLPPIPVVVGPANGVTDATPLLEWERVDLAYDGYDIQVATSSSFSSGSLVVNLSGYSQDVLSYHVFDAEPGLTHWWRVRSENSTGSSPWSTVRTFVRPLYGVPLGNDNTMEPDEGATGQRFTLTLEWPGVVNATGYDIQVAEGGDWNNADNYSTTNGSTTKTISVSSPLTTYHWRVKATNSVTESPNWSAEATFETLGPWGRPRWSVRVRRLITCR
jgi:hypothetical protein